MVFSSTLFLFCFLPAVLVSYFLVPRPLRNTFLFAVSIFFYAWGETFLVWLFLLSITINYLGGLAVGLLAPDQSDETGALRTHPRKQRVALTITIVANLALLAFFKYFNFAIESWNAFAGYIGANALHIADPMHITLPLGISFFTFHGMSYAIDVYRGDVRHTKNFINFATYSSLFPQLVAGPIVRYVQVSRDLVERTVSIEDFSEGVRRFVLGLGKKVIIANTVALPADQIFALPDSQITAPLAWFAVLCYTLQIYFDFSGYSDMAIGLGRMFGFHFLENFNYPYIARSAQDFWRRWHISLSTWFRDYVYIPLGGNRGGAGRTYFNLLTVFFLCGLWHGASWTFVAWGLYHGLFLAAERTRAGALLDRLWTPLRHIYALLVAYFGWLLFRAESFGQAGVFLGAMFGVHDASPDAPSLYTYWNNEVLLAIAAGIVGSTPWMPALGKWIGARAFSTAKPTGVALVASGQLAVTVFLLGVLVYSSILLSMQTHNPFIYFRF